MAQVAIRSAGPVVCQQSHKRGHRQSLQSGRIIISHSQTQSYLTERAAGVEVAVLRSPASHDLLVIEDAATDPALGAGRHLHLESHRPLLRLRVGPGVKSLELLRDVGRPLGHVTAGLGPGVVAPEMVPQRLSQSGPGVCREE